ncbi:carbamoyltransferase HypF [Aquabacterium sp.]|uniref:Kae1-like domain-containing protein n=1 Tax=Aquabacterium sp. TaxID=1872578 RepID=UPI003783E633
MPGLTTQALPAAAPATVLAAGAFLKNRACLLHGRELLWSPLQGDLSDPEACSAMEAALDSLASEASVRGWRIDAVAHDLHPDFPSTRAAAAWARHLDVPSHPVQHHHAHLGVVMAEQGWDGSEPVHGLALDGVGLGTDGTAWGGELLAARADGFERLAHLPALALPGGDTAAREPWRVAAAVLHQLSRADEIVPRFGPQFGEVVAAGVATLLARDLRCPRSSGAGRWFDAAAAALRLAPQRQTEAEAAIALERAATAWLAQSPMPAVPAAWLDLPTLVGTLFDETDPGRGAARFHAALATGLVQAAVRHGATRLALTGGCFHNRLLSREIEAGCAAHGLRTWRPQTVDCGDAGLALGQAWLVAHSLAAVDTRRAAALETC